METPSAQISEEIYFGLVHKYTVGKVHDTIFHFPLAHQWMDFRPAQNHGPDRETV